MQLPIINSGHADYLPFGGEAGIGMWTGYTTSVTKEGLGVCVLFLFICFSKSVDACNIMFS